MRYWFDTEFIEDGKTIDLLSIGIMAEDGRSLYLENGDADLSKANAWVRANVFTSMLWTKQLERRGIAGEVCDFCDPEKHGPPEFWAYYADYDWVVLCQLFGRMLDLPLGWPMYCRDFKQWLDEHGNPRLQKLPDNEAHNALADARWLKDEWLRLTRQQKGFD